MERHEYRLVNVAQTLLQSFPQSNSGDDVTITIYDVDDAATDVNGASMTFVSNSTWKYGWTPTELHNYIVKFRNATLDVDFYLFVQVVGTLVSAPSGSLGGSTFENLISRFLKLVDEYNANDLSTGSDNSNGDVAGLCINEALQLIYSQLKASKFLQDYDSSALISTANQAYIDLSAISNLDEIVALRDTTNNLILQYIAPEIYFLTTSNPANDTGTSFQYTRIFNRIYLKPRPVSAITYLANFLKTYPRLVATSDQSLIPMKFDPWTYAEAKVLWLEMMDKNNIAAIESAKTERDRTAQILLSDAMSQFDYVPQAESHWDGVNGYRQRIFKSPIDGT